MDLFSLFVLSQARTVAGDRQGAHIIDEQIKEHTRDWEQKRRQPKTRTNAGVQGVPRGYRTGHDVGQE